MGWDSRLELEPEQKSSLARVSLLKKIQKRNGTQEANLIQMKINFPQSTNQTETTHKSINNSKNRDNGVVNQQIIEQRQRTSLSIKQKTME